MKVSRARQARAGPGGPALFAPRRPVKAALAVLSAVLFVALIAGCFRPSALETVEKRKTIVVGTASDNEPFEYVDATTGRLTGFDIELMEALAARLGVAVEWKDMSFDRLWEALRSGEVDAIIADVGVTPERLRLMDFTDQYLVSPDGVLVRKGSGITLVDPAELAGYKVGARTGASQYGWLEANLVDTGKMARENLSAFDRTDRAVAALEAGQVDAVFTDEAVADSLAATHPVEKVLVCQLPGDPGIAVRKGERELVARLDELLAELRREGVIRQLAGKYQLAGD